MAKYRLRAVAVEACQYGHADWSQWCMDHGFVPAEQCVNGLVMTNAQNQRYVVVPGHWIVKVGDGAFMCYVQAEFDQLYEPAS